MPKIEVNGVELAYEIEGSGPPLVLVHGSWIDRHGWDLVVEGFARGFALGPGSWDRLPHALRATMVANAPTFAEEVRDPESRWVDLDGLRAFGGPTLLTEGGLGPAWYGAVTEQLAQVLPRVSRHLYPGAGHMPQATHAEEYVEVVEGFLRKADAGSR